MWNVIGLALALVVAFSAWRASLARGGYYDAEAYGMTPSAHRRYALTSLAFGGYFAATLALHQETAGIAGLALYAVVAVLYGASFLRGASHDEHR